MPGVSPPRTWSHACAPPEHLGGWFASRGHLKAPLRRRTGLPLPFPLSLGLLSSGIRNSCCRDAIPNHPKNTQPEPSAPFLPQVPFTSCRCRAGAEATAAQSALSTRSHAQVGGSRWVAGAGPNSPCKSRARPKTQVCGKEAQLKAQGSLTSPCLAEGHTLHLTPPAPHRFQVAGAQGTVAMHRVVNTSLSSCWSSFYCLVRRVACFLRDEVF